jgi:endonuclease YncB( thermonuclease family)
MRPSVETLKFAAVALAYFMAVLAVAPAAAETFDGDRIIVMDGDTVALPCDVPAKGCSEKIRLLEIDAPESFRPSCDAEGVAGLKAKERLATLIRGGKVEVTRNGIDRYGRTLGNLKTASGDAGAILMKEGLALAYRPGRDAKASRIAHWCGPGNW